MACLLSASSAACDISTRELKLPTACSNGDRARRHSVPVQWPLSGFLLSLGGQLLNFGEIPFDDFARLVGYRRLPVTEELGDERERGIWRGAEDLDLQTSATRRTAELSS